ncbi:dUTP diphosphatase [Saccharobesus litoralis]|uniref:dUTP diphosphatase n=1 Tax=Saccharobesus litoralis TaxID=2172099 RepID=A0A2S0VVY5_9ALTE|nr:dUTP diphosphatase [Saccharobesus litoralis]AWB68384.1 dUTP diphosphatase [Saccharobesus litoralis]
MLVSAQAATMLALQDKMNAKVNPDWIAVRSPFLRAVVIEGSEAIEHHGWKWWKKQDCDLEQLQMELVDIWHFVLSAILIKHQGDQAKAQQEVFAELDQTSLTFDGNEFEFSQLSLLDKLELMIGLAAAKRYSVSLFSALLTDCQMSWDDLYAQYVSKNVLNFFRQDHGYKEGTYIKEWSGREDNEHLVEIMTKLDVKSDSYQDDLYSELNKRYQLLNVT